jgi:bifunctional DNA-binding transcriptional regulator/antitoxin component of YhaV-PrlF toxin-antitoxin module
MVREVLATITSKGQVTIPVEVRRMLKLTAPGKVAFLLDDESGEVNLEAPEYPTVESLRGIFGSLPEPLPWETVLEIAREDGVTGADRGDYA